MTKGYRAERCMHGQRPGQPGHPSTPTSDLPARPPLGIASEQKVHVPFLSRGPARVLGWPLVGGGMALAAWFARTMHRADATLRTDKPVSRLVQDGPFRYSRNPGYLSL